MLKNKIVSAAEAVALVRDGDTVAVSGFVGIGTPDELLIALRERFDETQHPAGLTLMFAAAPGDGKERGLNRLAGARPVSASSAGTGRSCRSSARLPWITRSRPTTCPSAASRI